MLSVFKGDMVVWIDIGHMNAKGIPRLGPVKFFSQITAKEYRLRKPQTGRMVQRAPIQGLKKKLPGYAPPPPEPLGQDVWSVDDTSRGESNDPERNFRWLPYWPGHITYTDIVPGKTIVTGRMSGCLLVIFRMNGLRYFGHIGTTDLPSDETSIRVKNSWKVLIGNKTVELESQFNPASNVARGANETLGALSGRGSFYSIDMLSVGPNKFKVVDKNLRIGDDEMPFNY